MPEKQCADDSNNDKLFQKLVTEVIDGPVNELAAIVGGNDFNAFRQASFQRFQFVLHGGDNVAGVFAGPQDHHAASDFALAVQFGNATAHFGASLDLGNIAQINGHAIFTGF